MWPKINISYHYSNSSKREEYTFDYGLKIINGFIINIHSKKFVFPFLQNIPLWAVSRVSVWYIEKINLLSLHWCIYDTFYRWFRCMR